jgi:hypothetical protein
MESKAFDALVRQAATEVPRRGFVRTCLVVLSAAVTSGFIRPNDTLSRSRQCKPQCGECQDCDKGPCVRWHGRKRCKAGRCRPATDGVACAGGSCQGGTCILRVPPSSPPPPPVPVDDCTDQPEWTLCGDNMYCRSGACVSGAADCLPGAEYCSNTNCGSTQCYCRVDGSQGFCQTTVSGHTRCGLGQGWCGCTSDADCIVHFGLGAYCGRFDKNLVRCTASAAGCPTEDVGFCAIPPIG